MVWIFAVLAVFGLAATIANVTIHAQEGWPRLAIYLSVVALLVGLWGVAANEL